VILFEAYGNHDDGVLGRNVAARQKQSVCYAHMSVPFGCTTFINSVVCNKDLEAKSRNNVLKSSVSLRLEYT